MWLKQCHKLPIWEWFIPPISGDLVIWGMVYDCFNHIFLPLVVMDESNPFEKTYHNGKLTTQACKVAAFFFVPEHRQGSADTSLGQPSTGLLSP